MDIRSRYFSELDLNKSNGADANQAYTQQRIILDFKVKSDDFRGKLSLWNDYDTWGRFESPQGDQTTAAGWSPLLSSPSATNSGYLTVREAWIDFTLPGTPIGITVGHQFIVLDQGWFLRSGYAGSDAWVVSTPIANHTLALVDLKAFEGGIGSSSDDIDLYTGLDTIKLNDTMTAGIDVTLLRDRAGKLIGNYEKFATGATPPAAAKDLSLTNVGLSFTGKTGPVKLKAEVDIQEGKWKGGASNGDDVTFSGNQIVLQGSLPIDSFTINATIARGSGDKHDKGAGIDNKNEAIITLMDATQHYTLLYDYKIRTAEGFLYTGFANTTAVSIGAMYRAAKSIEFGGDVWYLLATEKTNINSTAGGFGTGGLSNDIGTEVDLKANWLLSEHLNWLWQAAYFKPGNAYRQADGTGTDAALGVQGVLSFRF